MTNIGSTSEMPVVLTDADNTLWDTNGVYAEAQLELLASVENRRKGSLDTEDKLAWIRELDQGLAERHHARLRYPMRLLAKAVALRLVGYDAADAIRFAWTGGRQEESISEAEAEEIENNFIEALAHHPALRKGVRDGLPHLKKIGCKIIVLTEGHKKKVLSSLDHYGLADLIEQVIEGPKRHELFERVLKLAGQPANAFMIGDQLDRDILPAKAAGLTTIYFPGGFQPKWGLSEDIPQADHSIDDFTQAVEFIKSIIPPISRDGLV